MCWSKQIVMDGSIWTGGHGQFTPADWMQRQLGASLEETSAPNMSADSTQEWGQLAERGFCRVISLGAVFPTVYFWAAH